MACSLRMILRLMSSSLPEPESPRRIEIRRFPNWGELREWVVGEASPADPGQVSGPASERLQIVVPGTGAAWVFDRMLRARLLEGSPLPWVGVADRALRDLAGDLEPPFRVAPRLTREILIEEALLAGASEPEVPPGDPAQLADPLLAFLDEQAKDAHLRPDGSAFEAFAERTARRLAEAQETDEGALRLLALTRWLRRTHRRYQEALEAVARVDPGSLRDRLLRFAPALRPMLLRTRVLAVGEDALRLADAGLFATLLPPGGLWWALPADAPPPFPRGLLPRWLEVRETPMPGGSPAAGTLPSPPRKQPTLFSAPFPAPPVPAPPLKAGPPKETPTPPAIYVPESGSGLVCRVTDREAEVRTAASVILRFRENRGKAFRGYERCALVAQEPYRYLESAETLLSGLGIPFDTHLDSRLSSEPWVAAVSDVLEFGAHSGRISVGLNLLRNPFFLASELTGVPARAADILQKQALDAGLRDTNDPEAFPALAIRLGGRAEEIRREQATVNSPAIVERRLGRAESLETAAAALRTLASAAGRLRPVRDPGTGFQTAVEALLDFLETCLEPPAEGDGEVKEAVLQTLRQAAAAAPPGALAGGPGRFPRRIRRLLNGRTLGRRPPPDTGTGTGGGGIHRGGVSLIAASDAPFGDYDLLVLLGVADADWPGPRPRNIFFPNHLLEEATRSRHSRARQREIRLLRAIPGLPRTAALFTRPELDDGFPVAVSPFEVELAEAIGAASPAHSRIQFPEPRVTEGPPERAECEPLPTTLDRRAPSAAVLERPVSPTALDTCAASPAQFFARYVLRLDEERQLADVPPPTERGEILHEFLEESYRALGARGLAVRESALEDLLAFFRGEFRRFASARGMDATERRGEERWLFGGEATPGAMEWFLREEADRGPSLPVQFEQWIGGEPEPAAPGTPRLRVEGRLDRLDQRPDGTRRVVEYKSGRFYQKPLQARLYARILEAADGAPTDFAIPYFGSRRWIGPEDTPKDAEQDAQLAEIRDQLATGAFPPAPGKDGNFDFQLVIRRDLPERAPEPPPAPPTDS